MEYLSKMENKILELQIEVISLLDTIHKAVEGIQTIEDKRIVANHIQESIRFLSQEALNSTKNDKGTA